MSKFPSTFNDCGVDFMRLNEEYIEMVRRWRMKPEIVSKMEYRGVITPEMQRAWFHRIDNDLNFYYIAYCKREPVGCVNLKDLDYNNRSAEGGIFIGEPEKTDAFFGLRCVIAMYNFGFTILGLKTIRIHVLRDNPGAIRMNQLMGFQLLPNQNEDVYNQEYQVTQEVFEQKASSLRKRFNNNEDKV